MRSLTLGILLTLSALPAFAAESARTRMEAFSRGLESVSGRFSQSVTDANGHQGDASSGTFALQAPRQFRWETQSPYQQTIVADGRRVWVYEPDLEQVSVKAAATALTATPASLLSGDGKLGEYFTVSADGRRDERTHPHGLCGIAFPLNRFCIDQGK